MAIFKDEATYVIVKTGIHNKAIKLYEQEDFRFHSKYFNESYQFEICTFMYFRNKESNDYGAYDFY